MGRKIKEGGKFPCRFGCGKVYYSKSGRRGHEIKIHGSIYPNRDVSKDNLVDDKDPENTSTDSENQQFVKIDEVKYMAAKKVNAKDKEDEYECGACGETFSEKKKFCPNCGVEFE